MTAACLLPPPPPPSSHKLVSQLSLYQLDLVRSLWYFELSCCSKFPMCHSEIEIHCQSSFDCSAVLQVFYYRQVVLSNHGTKVTQPELTWVVSFWLVALLEFWVYLHWISFLFYPNLYRRLCDLLDAGPPDSAAGWAAGSKEPRQHLREVLLGDSGVQLSGQPHHLLPARRGNAKDVQIHPVLAVSKRRWPTEGAITCCDHLIVATGRVR